MVKAKKLIKATDSNGHIKRFLHEYISSKHRPHYAVMLNGPWGIGKTFLVRGFLKEQLTEEQKYVYVSLYGLSSTAEIDAALMRSIHPFLASKGVEVATRLAKTVAKAFRIDTDVSVTEFLSKFKAGVYVFDDLERSNMSINEVMGYINEFVEHDGSKVIIIANEQEIENSSEGARYILVREKLIGKRFEIQSAFNEALSYFLSLVESLDASSILSANKTDIAHIYDQAELNNLRILQQTIWDFERVIEALKASQRQNKAAMNALLQLFFSLSFEVRSGRLTAAQLESRKNGMIASMIAHDKDRKVPAGLSATMKRYPEVNVLDTILSDQLIVDLLIRGRVDDKALQESLNRSNYLVNPSKEPSWRVLWNWFERDEKDFETAKAAIRKQFEKHSIVKTGELLHIFGLELFFSDNQIIDETRDAIVSRAKDYIDSLLTLNRLEPLYDSDHDELRFHGYGGLGIHEYDKPDYIDIQRYLEQQRRVAAQRQFPLKAAKLLRDMEVRVDSFYEQICLSDPNVGVYTRIPVLSAIDYRVFVSKLLEASSACQRIIFLGLNQRYDHGRLHTDLKPEFEWLTAVSAEIERQVESLPAIVKLRILRNRDWNIGKHLKAE